MIDENRIDGQKNHHRLFSRGSGLKKRLSSPCPYIEIASWQIMQMLTMYMYALHCYIHTCCAHQLMIHVEDMEINKYCSSAAVYMES